MGIWFSSLWCNVGGPYGTVLHQNSPYAHAPPPPPPAPVHRGGEEQQRHHRVDIPGRLVRIFCKANPNFHVSVRPGKGVVMAPVNPHDDYQVCPSFETWPSLSLSLSLLHTHTHTHTQEHTKRHIFVFHLGFGEGASSQKTRSSSAALSFWHFFALIRNASADDHNDALSFVKTILSVC
jgi:hypothetical protein